MGLFSKLFAPGNKYIKHGMAASQRAVPTYGSFYGPGGISSGFNVGPGGAISLSGGLGAFDPIMSQLLMGGPSFSPVDTSFISSLMQGGAPQIDRSMIDRLSGMAGGVPGFGGQLDLGEVGGAERAGLSQLFQSALGTAGADPFALGASVTSRLQPGLQRAQETLRGGAFEQLFNRGGSAVSTVASPVLENLQKQFAEQNAALDVMGLDIGRGLQSDAIGRLFGAQQGIAGIDAANAARMMQNFQAGLQGYGANLQGYGMGADILSGAAGMGLTADQLGMQGFGQMADLARLGLGAQELDLNRQFQEFAGGLQNLGMGMNLAQLPLQFQSALMAMQGLKSQTDLGIGSNIIGGASKMQSPLVNFGQFLSGIFQPQNYSPFGIGG